MSHPLNVKYVASLLRLASDENPRVRRPVEAYLHKLGADLLPYLQELFHSDAELRPLARRWWGHLMLLELPDRIRHWYRSASADLLQGIWLMTLPAYPELSLETLRRLLFHQVLNAWMEAKSYYSFRELIQSLNYSLFVRQQFQRMVSEVYHPDAFFLHLLFKERKGSPLTLAILYVLVAQRLGIPAFGVSLPYYFVVAVMERRFSTGHGFPTRHFLPTPSPHEKVAFYINPYRKGSFFFRHQLEDFLAQLGLEAKPEYYRPCPNITILLRMAYNLEVSYRQAGDEPLRHRYALLRKKVLYPLHKGNIVS